MNLDVALVRHGQLYAVLPGLIEYLKKSEKWSRGRASVDDIIAFLYSKRMFLLLIHDVETLQPYGYVIAETTQYPQSKILTVQYCAIEPHTYTFIIEKMTTALDVAAKSLDCQGIEFNGRPGWDKLMKRFGFNAKSVIYEKYFGDDNGTGQLS